MLTAIGNASELNKTVSSPAPSLKAEIAESTDVTHKTFRIPCFNSDKRICALDAKKNFSSKIYFDKQNKMNVFSCQVDPKSKVTCNETKPVDNKFASRPSSPTVTCQVVSSNCVLPTHEKTIKAKVVQAKCAKGFKGLYSRVEQAVVGPKDYRDILVACISDGSYQAQASAKIPQLVLD
jgi:hypothetical protein